MTGHSSGSLNLCLQPTYASKLSTLMLSTKHDKLVVLWLCAMVNSWIPWWSSQTFFNVSELVWQLESSLLIGLNLQRCRATLFTDSQYVINVVNTIRKFGPLAPLHKMANPDLVHELAQLWTDELFAIFKVKSHRSFNDAKDWEDLWAIYGNSLADTAAGQALARIPNLCKEWIEDSKTRHVNEQEALKITWSYLAQLNLERQKLPEIA